MIDSETMHTLVTFVAGFLCGVGALYHYRTTKIGRGK